MAGGFSCESDAIRIGVVDALRARLPDADYFGGLADRHKALSDATRLRILWALTSGELCVCEIAALLGITKYAVSHQLKTMRLTNLVRCEKRGKAVFYSLAAADGGLFDDNDEGEDGLGA